MASEECSTFLDHTGVSRKPKGEEEGVGGGPHPSATYATKTSMGAIIGMLITTVGIMQVMITAIRCKKTSSVSRAAAALCPNADCQGEVSMGIEC